MDKESCNWKGRSLYNSASWGPTKEHLCWKGPWEF